MSYQAVAQFCLSSTGAQAADAAKTVRAKSVRPAMIEVVMCQIFCVGTWRDPNHKPQSARRLSYTCYKPPLLNLGNYGNVVFREHGTMSTHAIQPALRFTHYELLDSEGSTRL